MHASLVGITVPRFYAAVEPQPIEPTTVRAKLKGQIWFQPQLTYQASARHVWIAAPQASWPASAKIVIAPPRTKVAWYVRPATLKATAFVGAPIKGEQADGRDAAAARCTRCVVEDPGRYEDQGQRA